MYLCSELRVDECSELSVCDENTPWIRGIYLDRGIGLRERERGVKKLMVHMLLKASLLAISMWV